MKSKTLTATCVTVKINQIYVSNNKPSLSFSLIGLDAPLTTPKLHKWLVTNNYCTVVITPTNIKRYHLTSKGLEANLGTNGYKYLKFSSDAPQLIYDLLRKDEFF